MKQLVRNRSGSTELYTLIGLVLVTAKLYPAIVR
jgi:hypothetical protein